MSSKAAQKCQVKYCKSVKWNPSIRSKTSIRSSPKRNFIDPSVAAAALGISPEYFSGDYKTLGFLFECMCIRDLKIIITGTKYGYKREDGVFVIPIGCLKD